MKSKKVNSAKTSPTRKPHTPGNLPIAAQHLITRLGRNAGKKNIMEDSHIIDKLVLEYHVPIKVIALRANMCESHVYNYRNIANLPSKVQKLIQTGKIAPTIALGVIRNIRNEKEMIDVINKYIADCEFDKKNKKFEGSSTEIRKKMVSKIEKMVAAGLDVKSMPKSLLKSLDKTLKQFQHQASA